MRESEKSLPHFLRYGDVQLRRSVADFEKIVEGFGMFPNKILQKAAPLKFAKCTMCVHTCPACYRCSHLSKQIENFQFFAKSAKLDFAKNRRVYLHLLFCYTFDEKGNIVVKNLSAFWLPDVKIVDEIGGTEYTVTGSYEGTETLDKKLHRIMEQNAADDESGITEDGE